MATQSQVIELIGDLWTAPLDYPHPAQERIVLVPTNGIVVGGRLVMGAGVAKQAALYHPELPAILGERVAIYGNHSYAVTLPVGDPYNYLLTWPTKKDWRDPSDLDLIVREAKRIMGYLTRTLPPDDDGIAQWTPSRIAYAPLVGCGLGGLDWHVVREVLAPIVGDKIFFVKQRS